jgi:dTDP-4-dehydrorhamnose 3,5-epimerase
VTFEKTPLQGACVIHPDRFEDERGFFARTFCAREFEEQGLNAFTAQCNTSGNRLRGTLRGLHWQEAPHSEVKLVRCTAGGLYDVIVDLRADSPTFKRWFGIELTPHNGLLL